MTSSSSAASPLSCMRNNSEGDSAFDNSSDDVENDQEDSESSDVEIYLDSNNSAEHKHVLSSTGVLQFFFLIHSSRICASIFGGAINIGFHHS
jgi:hypothetical protein